MATVEPRPECVAALEHYLKLVTGMVIDSPDYSEDKALAVIEHVQNATVGLTTAYVIIACAYTLLGAIGSDIDIRPAASIQ